MLCDVLGILRRKEGRDRGEMKEAQKPWGRICKASLRTSRQVGVAGEE